MAVKPCPAGQERNEKTNRCRKIAAATSASSSKKSKSPSKSPSKSSSKSPSKSSKKVAADERAIQDVAMMKQIQNDYLEMRSEYAKMEKERDKYREAYENMVRTMAKCHEDLKQERRR
jgi:hypothetical protein